MLKKRAEVLLYIVIKKKLKGKGILKKGKGWKNRKPDVIKSSKVPHCARLEGQGHEKSKETKEENVCQKPHRLWRPLLSPEESLRRITRSYNDLSWPHTHIQNAFLKYWTYISVLGCMPSWNTTQIYTLRCVLPKHLVMHPEHAQCTFLETLMATRDSGFSPSYQKWSPKELYYRPRRQVANKPKSLQILI